MTGFPSERAPIVDDSGQLTPAWHRFFASLVQGAQAAKPQTVGPSPYPFTAPAAGSLVVSGGTVSAIALTRGRVTVDLGAVSGHFPASTGDKFTLTYSVTPLGTFLPG